MNADPFFQLLGMVAMLVWSTVKLVFRGVFWLVSFGKWKFEVAQFERQVAAARAGQEATEQQRRAELRSRNTLHGP